MPRFFISKPRCIYTGAVIDSSSATLKPSHEHIIPLSLGGSNQFTTEDVSLTANNLAGKEIDDAVASSFPFLMLRHRYGLKGNRKTIPNVKIKGEFLDLSAPATLEIGPAGDLKFSFEEEQKIKNGAISLASSEDRIRYLLKGRLEQANKRQLSLVSQFGQIKDEDDIEAALMLADRNEGRDFKGTVSFDIAEFNAARAHLLVKIALGLGHRVLGPEWTFGPGGMKLRSHLFPNRKDLNFGTLRGSIDADIPENIRNIFGVADDRHVMAVLPVGKRTFATIALFGGQIGTAVIDLGFDSRRKFNAAINQGADLDCLFSIPLNVSGSRPLQSRSIHQTATAAAMNGLLPKSRRDALLQLGKK